MFRNVGDQRRNVLTVYKSLTELRAAERLSVGALRDVERAFDDRDVEDLDI